MNFMEQRIVADGVVKNGQVLKVDSFLNHQLDVDLLEQAAKQWAADLALLGNLNVLSAGVPLAAAKGKGWMPHQALAWNVAAQRGAWPVAEVDYPTALAYLRGEAVVIDAPRGYVLLTHRGRHMGFVNNLGNRANNLYPKPLRILTSHLPDTPPTIL